ncbi:MAG: hypothetical protein ACK55I_46565, partial [bacterium]
LTIARHVIPIPQPWGIPLIAASAATVFFYSQLASGSRLSAADEEQFDRDRADPRRDLAREKDSERIKKESEQLRQKTASLSQQNTKETGLSVPSSGCTFRPRPARSRRHQPRPIANLPELAEPNHLIRSRDLNPSTHSGPDQTTAT